MTVASAYSGPASHRPAARPVAGSTAGLAPALRARSRGANLLPPFGRETIRAANVSGRVLPSLMGPGGIV